MQRLRGWNLMNDDLKALFCGLAITKTLMENLRLQKQSLRKIANKLKRGPYLFNEKMVWNNPSLYRGGVP